MSNELLQRLISTASCLVATIMAFGLAPHVADAAYRPVTSRATIKLGEDERAVVTRIKIRVQGRGRSLACLNRGTKVFAGLLERTRRNVFLVPIPSQKITHRGQRLSRRGAATLCAAYLNAGLGSSSSSSSSVASSESSSQSSLSSSSMSQASSSASSTQQSSGQSSSTQTSSAQSSSQSSNSSASSSEFSSSSSAPSSSSTSSSMSSSQSSSVQSSSSSANSSQSSSSQSSSSSSSSSLSSSSQSSSSAASSGSIDQVYGLCTPQRLGLDTSNRWDLATNTYEGRRVFSNGDYLLVGRGAISFERVVFARATPDCTLRTTWGEQGVAVMHMPAGWPVVDGISRSVFPNDFRVTSDDKVIFTGHMPMLGSSTIAGNSFSFLGILAADGLPDPSAIDYPTFKVFQSDFAASMKLLVINEGAPEERWIALGSTFVGSALPGNPIWMFHTNGSFDSSVWPGGIGRSSLSFSPALNAGAITWNQTITAGGISGSSLVLRRYDLYTGAMVESFGNAGMASIDLSPLGATGGYMVGGVAKSDGSMIITVTLGEIRQPNARVVVAAIDATGNLLNDFGTAGLLIVGSPENLPPPSTAHPVVVQSDGKLLVFAASYLGQSDPSWTTQVSRYTSNGLVDTSYGTGGYVDLDLELASLGFTPRTGVIPPQMVLVQPDNHVVAGEGFRTWRMRP